MSEDKTKVARITDMPSPFSNPFKRRQRKRTAKAIQLYEAMSNTGYDPVEILRIMVRKPKYLSKSQRTLIAMLETLPDARLDALERMLRWAMRNDDKDQRRNEHRAVIADCLHHSRRSDLDITDSLVDFCSMCPSEQQFEMIKSDWEAKSEKIISELQRRDEHHDQAS